MMQSPYRVVRKPVVTEKGLEVKERARTLVFQVDVHANKAEVKQAVEAIFKVKVESVHTARFHGKIRRRGRLFGFRPDWKKAYVKLREGEKMPEYAETV